MPTGGVPPSDVPGAGSNPDYSGWPRESEPVSSAMTEKIFEAQVAARGKRIESAIARVQAYRQADLDQNAEFQKALLEVGKNGIERARSNAETVQKAAGAIGTICAGILGVAFSVPSAEQTRGD